VATTKPTAPYTIFKEWFKANLSELKELPKSFIHTANGVETEYAIRKQCVDPLKDLYEAIGEKKAIGLLAGFTGSSGRGRPQATNGELRRNKVGKKSLVVVTAGYLGVKEGEYVTVKYSDDKITITKEKFDDEYDQARSKAKK
jgi:hypothetical protein